MADAPMTVVRRLASGDLTEYGLPCPEEGIFARQHREGKAPAIVDREVIEAIKDRRIQIVAGVHSLDATGVLLADGWRIEPAAIIAATGYRRDLERMVATSACSTIGAHRAWCMARRPHPGCASSATSRGPGKSATWASKRGARPRASPDRRGDAGGRAIAAHALAVP